MRIDALLRRLAADGRVKVFVATEEFCMCGYITRAQAADDAVLVELGSSVRHNFVTGAVVEERFRSGTLMVVPTTRMTRRLKTHRLHLAQHRIPERYFRIASVL